MSDLISRQEVEKAIKDYFKMIIDNTDDDIDCVLDYNKNLCDAIREIPTAYDVDKVVEQLEKRAFWTYFENPIGQERCAGYVNTLFDAFYIVKGAVKDD